MGVLTKQSSMKISDGDANYSKSCGYMVEVGVHIIYIYDIYI